MNSYFIARSGQQFGPYTHDELRQQGLRKADMVWCHGMSDWMQAGSVPELAELFPQYGNQGAYQQAPNPQPNPYAQAHSSSKRPQRSIGLLVMSILGILGSLIQLIISAGMFIAAAESRRGYYWNDDCYYVRGEMAETYTITGVLLLIGGVFFLILSIMGIVAGSRKHVRV